MTPTQQHLAVLQPTGFSFHTCHVSVQMQGRVGTGLCPVDGVTWYIWGSEEGLRNWGRIPSHVCQVCLVQEAREWSGRAHV